MEMSVNMKNEKFTCAYCGTEFATIKERTTCEVNCARKQEEAERQSRKELFEKERLQRKQVVDEAFDTAFELQRQYIKDYGKYGYSYLAKFI